MKKGIFLIGMVLVLWGVGSEGVWGQVTIAKQGFETSGETWSITNGSSNISTTTGSGDTPANQRILAGSRSWQVINGSATLELASVNVSTYSSIKVNIRVSSTSVSTGNGSDSGDNIRVYVSLNGAGFPGTADLTLSGNTNARWGYNATLTATTSAGTPISVSAPQGGTNTNNYSTLEISIPNSTNTVALRLIGLNNDNNEIWNIDEVVLTGTSSCTSPSTQASAFTSTNIQTTQMDIGWTRGDGDSVLVVARQGSAVNADPTNGTSYAANAAFGSGAQIGTGNYVVYKGTGTSVTVTSLSHTTAYYYAVYEYNGTGVCYNLTELQGNATTLSPPSEITHTGTAIASADIVQNTTNNVLYRVQTTVATVAATLTQLVATTGGTWANGDISNFKLWFSTNDSFGGDTEIASVSNPSPGDVTFTVSNQSFPIGTRYLFITCDVASGATIGNTVSAAPDADGDFTYSAAPTYSGSSFQAANNMTIIGFPEIQLQSPVDTDISCGAAALSLGSVIVGNSSNITVRIKNLGTSNLNLNSLPLTLGGSHPGDYSITTQPTSPITPGNFSDMVVQFTPTTTGTRTANISISNNDSNENPCTVSFTGVGLLANDNCSGATALTVYSVPTCGGSTNGTTVGATNSSVSGCAGTAEDDVWYSFVATNDKHTITVVGASPLDAVVDLRSGACNGTNLACADATASGGTEVINATGLTNGNTYFVRIYGFGNNSGFGTFTVCVTTPPPPYHFRSKQAGAWTSALTWEVSTDEVTWTDASAAPGTDDLTIKVQHAVSISSGTVTIDQLTIESGHTLELENGATLSISNGPDAEDLRVLGTLRNAGTVSGAGTISVKNGGIYQHNYTTNYGTIPTATWEAGSTCEIIGYTNPTAGGFPTGIGQTFSNFTWNTTNLTTNPNLSGSSIIATGTFSVLSTNSAELRLGTNSSGSISTTNYSQTGGTLNCSAGNGAGSISVSGNFDMSGGTLTESGSGSGTVIFNGTNQTFNKTGGTVSNTINFTVNGGSALNVGTSVMTGAGAFTLSSGATLLTSHPNGLTGSIAVSGTKTFNPAANYEFQSAETGTFANTANNVIINRAGGVSLSSSLTVNSTLTLTNGNLNLNGNTLVFNTISGIPAWGSTANNYIVAESGFLSKTNPSATVFPIGTASNYMPCRLTANGSYGVNLSTIVGGLSEPNAVLNRQWNITGPAGTISLDVQWPTGTQGVDFPSSPSTSNLFLFRQNGATWTNVGNPASVSGSDPKTASFTEISCCSGFVPGGENALPVELISFQAIPLKNSTLLSWRTASEVNNSHFVIEHSTAGDGDGFREIGREEGNGTSYALNEYRFIHENPAPGLNYYRLRQVDFDGRSEYSKVVSVYFEHGRQGPTAVHPTLATEEVTVWFAQPTPDEGFVEIVDYQGRRLHLLHYGPETDRLSVPVSNLPLGTYLVRVQSGGRVENLRFVKM